MAGKAVVPQAQLTLSLLAISMDSASSDLNRNIFGLGGTFVPAMVLVAVQVRSNRKLLPPAAFHFRSAIATLYTLMSLLVLTVTSGEVFAPLFLQVLHQQFPLVAGYLTALMGAGWTVGAINSSGLGAESHCARLWLGLPWDCWMGLVILVPDSCTGSFLVLAPICLALALIGLGVGVAWLHLLIRVLKAVPPQEQELAGASIATIQLFATASGAALAGMVANAGGLIDPGGVEGTRQAAYYLFVIFAVAPLLGIGVARNCRA